MKHVYPEERIAELGLVRLAERLLPQPYRSLLVHCRDMTRTLERFYGERMALRPLRRNRQPGAYWREVTLNLQTSSRPVEYGILRVNLEHFSPSASRLILEAQKPLGAILEIEAIAHMSWPLNFFRLDPDPHMTEVLNLDDPVTLYGRHNLLLDESRRLLAEVIEVLAPAVNITGSCQRS
jgi:hypothetical protein